MWPRKLSFSGWEVQDRGAVMAFLFAGLVWVHFCTSFLPQNKVTGKCWWSEWGLCLPSRFCVSRRCKRTITGSSWSQRSRRWVRPLFVCLYLQLMGLVKQFFLLNVFKALSLHRTLLPFSLSSCWPCFWAVCLELHPFFSNWSFSYLTDQSNKIERVLEGQRERKDSRLWIINYDYWDRIVYNTVPRALQKEQLYCAKCCTQRSRGWSPCLPSNESCYVPQHCL